MNDFVALGVLPGVAGIFGLFIGGPVGGFAGLFGAMLLGIVVVFVGDSRRERIEELEREVESLQRQLEDEE